MIFIFVLIISIKKVMTMPKLNNDICLIIAKYLIKPKYKLLDWININDINYKYLSSNPHPAAIELLKANPDKIDWDGFSLNSSIFIYDYKKIKMNFEELGEEIIAKALHPKRIFRLIEEYGEDEIYNIYFDDY